MPVNILKMFCITIFLMVLTSCETAQITDLIHKQTEKVDIEDGIDFSKRSLKDYQINGILFIPYTRQNSFESDEGDFETFSLRFVAYKPKEVVGNVVINSVKVEGVKDIKFTPISKILNLPLKFNDEEGNLDLQSSYILLVDEINSYNMKLTEKSKLKVIINISVEQNGNITAKDLIYYFETNIRKYLVQPT